MRRSGLISFAVLYDIGVFNIFVLSNNLPLNELNSHIAFDQLLVFMYHKIVALTSFTSNILIKLAGNDTLKIFIVNLPPDPTCPYTFNYES